MDRKYDVITLGNFIKAFYTDQWTPCTGRYIYETSRRCRVKYRI